MTLRAFLRVVLRRWCVILVVMMASGALTMTMQRDGGSFVSSSTVTFTLPTRSVLDIDNGSTDRSVIAFAGAVATEINDGRAARTYSSAGAPTFGAGVREGVMVSLRNDGNQWISSFPSATIDIQIVGRTAEWVRARQQAILAEVLDVTRQQQARLNAGPGARIEATVGPLSTEISNIRPGRSSTYAAWAAMGLAGTIAGVSIAIVIDRLRPYRRRGFIDRETIEGYAA